MSQQITYEHGKYKLIIQLAPDNVKLTLFYYPLKPYGNNQHTTLELKKADNNYYNITVTKINEDWNGTGVADRFKLTLPSDVIDNFIHKLTTTTSSDEAINTFNDFANKLDEYDNNIGEEIEQAFNNVTEELQKITEDQQILQFLQSSEAKDKIMELIREYLFS